MKKWRLWLMVWCVMLAAWPLNRVWTQESIIIERSGLELGGNLKQCVILQPLIQYRYVEGEDGGWFVGSRLTVLYSPLPMPYPQARNESHIVNGLLMPEASVFAGGFISVGQIVDFQIELNLGGDLKMEWVSLEIAEYGIKRQDFLWAITPWAWLNIGARFYPASLVAWQWLEPLRLEGFVTIGIGDHIFMDERLGWRLNLLYKL
jgi:hypothetical protein